MKRMLFLAMALLMTISLLAGCNYDSGASTSTPNTSGDTNTETPVEGKTLRLAWTVAYDENHPYTVAAETFKKYVEEKTEGRITVELYAGGQLGGDSEMLEMLQMGTLDVAVTSTPTVANFTNVLVGCDMPYIWQNDLSAMYSVLTEGDTGRNLLKRMQEEIDVVGVSFLYQPFRHIFTNKEITTIGDLNSLKFRCMQTPVHQEIFTAIGINPVSLAYNDIYSAMQQGTIDGFESDAVGAVTSKFYEVSKYLTISGHFNNTMVLLMSSSAYNGVSADDQAIIMEAGAEAAKASYDCSIAQDDAAIQTLQDNGMTICEIDMQPLYDAVQPVIDKYSADIPEVAELVVAAEAAVSK